MVKLLIKQNIKYLQLLKSQCFNLNYKINSLVMGPKPHPPEHFKATNQQKRFKPRESNMGHLMVI